MEFSEEKFEQSHGKICNIIVTPYKGPIRKETGEEDRGKDLKLIINKKLKFGDHPDKITLSCNDWNDNENFHHKSKKTDDENVQCINKSKHEQQHTTVLYGNHQSKLERIQKTLQAKSRNGAYHLSSGVERNQSLQPRKKRKIYDDLSKARTWGFQWNMFTLKASQQERNKVINTAIIPSNTVYQKEKKNNTPARKMEKVFNILPSEIRKLHGISTKNFKKLYSANS